MTDTVEQPVDPLADKIVSLKYSVKDVNGIINMMNKPFETPVMAWANLIANIQAQCTPQIEALNANAETPSEPQTAA